jgi:TRAP-type C4-dicarboxylate transport system substrate-binding protein
VVTKAVWEKLPQPQRDQMLKAAQEAGQDLRGGIRKMGDDAIVAMQKRKLNVVHADAAAVADWSRQAEAVYPKIRGREVPADLFDEVRRLRDEYRSRGGAR